MANNISSLSDAIGVLQSILARCQHDQIFNLETPYSRFPINYHSAVRTDRSIDAIITERQQQLDAVLHGISGLKTVMNNIKDLNRQLVEQKEKIIQSINLHKRLVSAFWRFPTEILSQIFHHCLPPASIEFQPTSKLEAPMLLTAVCRRWREIAADIPSLWCRLNVKVISRIWLRQAFSYDLWLQRSQGRPLSLALECYEDDETTKLRSLLQPYVNHITSLSVTFSEDVLHHDLLLQYFPALQALTVRTKDVLSIAKCISRLPVTLRSLGVLEYHPFDLDSISSCGSVWAHLTNVVITVNRPTTVLHLLQLAPNLSSLTIHILGYNDMVLEPFTHTNLQSLLIKSPRRHESSSLLDTLSLPNLRILEAFNIPHEKLKAFLVRSNCPLETLIFGGRRAATDEERMDYVSLIPSLKMV